MGVAFYEGGLLYNKELSPWQHVFIQTQLYNEQKC
jgi:hypothetical protein